VNPIPYKPFQPIEKVEVSTITKEQIQSLVAQAYKVKQIKELSDELFNQSNWSDKVINWAVENKTLEEFQPLKDSWKKQKELIAQLNEIIK
jgi:hypothetical protein